MERVAATARSDRVPEPTARKREIDSAVSWARLIRISRSDSAKGSGRSNSALTTEKIAVVAPMARPKQSTARRVEPRARVQDARGEPRILACILKPAPDPHILGAILQLEDSVVGVVGYQLRNVAARNRRPICSSCQQITWSLPGHTAAGHGTSRTRHNSAVRGAVSNDSDSPWRKWVAGRTHGIWGPFVIERSAFFV